MARDGRPQWVFGLEGRRRTVADDQTALQAANLCSPVFEESWRAGSPLNWCEFVARWQACGADEDAASGRAELEG